MIDIEAVKPINPCSCICILLIILVRALNQKIAKVTTPVASALNLILANIIIMVQERMMKIAESE